MEDLKKFYKFLKLVAVILIIIVAGRFLINNNWNWNNYETMSFTGYAEMQVIPDIAQINFTIRELDKTASMAQTKVAEINEKVLEFLKENEIEDKDIKTEQVAFNPKYEYRYNPCYNLYCPPGGKNVLTGYEAYQNISLKIRNTDQIGKIIEGLGLLKVTELNGPNFTVDNEEELKKEVRLHAILDAKTEAKILAKDLGVRLGKIIAYYDEADFDYPAIGYHKADMAMVEMAASSREPLQISKGENTLTARVTITYRLK